MLPLQRTVFVLVCKDEGIGGVRVVVRKGKNKSLKLEKTVTGSCIEGILEYARICFDLAPKTGITTIVSTRDVRRTNEWNKAGQSVQALLTGFNGTVPSESTRITQVLETAVRALGQPKDTAPPPGQALPDVHSKIVVLYQLSSSKKTDISAVRLLDQDRNTEIDMIDCLKYYIEKHNSDLSLTSGHSIKTFDLVFFPIVSEKAEVAFSPQESALQIKPAKAKAKRKQPTPEGPETPSDQTSPPPSKRRKTTEEATTTVTIKVATAEQKEALLDPMGIDPVAPLPPPTAPNALPRSAAIVISKDSAVASAELNFLKPSWIQDALIELCISHLDLNVVVATSIPMKEPVKQAKTSSQSATFLVVNSSIAKRVKEHFGLYLGTGMLWKLPNRLTTLKFQRSSAYVQPDLISSRSACKMTPWSLSSKAVRSIVSHVGSDKPLLFCTEAEDTLPSHVISFQGGQLFLFALLRDTINLFDIPGNLYHQSKVKKYRTFAMTELVEETRLDAGPIAMEDIKETKPLPFKSPGVLANKPPGTYGAVPAQIADSRLTLANLEAVGIGSNSSGVKEVPSSSNQIKIVTPKLLEAKTRYFPYYEEESVLWSSRECDALRTLLNFIKGPIMVPSMTEVQFGQVAEALQKVQIYRETNEVRMFPNTKNSVNRRRDLYVSLSEELRRFAQAHKQNSALHQQVFEIANKYWPPQPDQPTTPVSAASPALPGDSLPIGSLPKSRVHDPNFKQMDESLAGSAAYRSDMATAAKEDLSWGVSKGKGSPALTNVPNKLHEATSKASLYSMYWRKKEVAANESQIELGNW